MPRYQDRGESDVFILSGSEDLTPAFKLNRDGELELDLEGKPVVDEESRGEYSVRHYRPRIEGLFARIERWTKLSDPSDVHWRSISKDNILTLYGKDANSRITDPEDSVRIFSWLICETRDDKGNAILYEYKEEDGVGVDLTQAHQRNRGPQDNKKRKTNRYLKRIKYGNRKSLLDETAKRLTFLTHQQIAEAGWMFEVVFDYFEGHILNEITDGGQQTTVDVSITSSRGWTYRNDPFSSYRSGFEIRTSRLCQRVLMFHHFPDEGNVGEDCLVRSTDFVYSFQQNPNEARNPIYSFLQSVVQSSYERKNGAYLKRSFPPIEFEYSQPQIQEIVEDVDPESLENLPVGLDNATYQWMDLHGEGIPGLLTEQAGAWFYKRNISLLNIKEHDGGKHIEVQFAPMELVSTKPNMSLKLGAQFMDLAGDGQPDLVMLNGSVPGLYEHDDKFGWHSFRSFPARLQRRFGDLNLRFIDLDGDGHSDVLITEENAFVWHISQAEDGFGPAQRVYQPIDEEHGPRLIFANDTQSIYLADLSGDGLIDIVRIRNGEICYWPNLGYAHFGAKVTMDNAPWFDHADQFDQRRIRLADIDGSGTTDILYLHKEGIRVYFNQSGNSWSPVVKLSVFPPVDNIASINTTDLLGNGTACLVWSSPLLGLTNRQMRYINLMGTHKPHLLIRISNNLGAETRVEYASSTKFYLQDRRDGKPWITRLPFPVHVVERVESYDHVSRNRFVTGYDYHHGFFDGEEREFRGFGMVEQRDTESFATLSANGLLSDSDNFDLTSHVPPVITRTWFHTGIYMGGERVSNFYAGMLDSGDRGEYYREPAWLDDDSEASLRQLPDTPLPNGLSITEDREASRALKGSMLRQEIYALDGSGTEDYPYGHPYTVVEQNFTVEMVQPQGNNRNSVFFTHPREVITYSYDRNPEDPRVGHMLTLEADKYGNILKSLSIGYGRRQSPLPEQRDRDMQITTSITYTINNFTNPIDDVTLFPDDYRSPLPTESRTYELTGFAPGAGSARFSFDEWTQDGFALLASAAEIPYEQIADNVTKEQRLVERVRTLYRRDNLTSLLPPGEQGRQALPGESYKLAFTPGLLNQVYQRGGQSLVSDPASVLGGLGADQGGYVDLDGDGHWWIPSGRAFYSTNTNDTPEQELSQAIIHFFLVRRFRDPFGWNTTIDYDGPADPTPPRYNLLVTYTEDALHNVTRAEIDYRVLQAWRMTDPNHNRTEVAFDTLGLVVGTAVKGKIEEDLGDSLTGFEPDLTQTQIDDFYQAEDPHLPGLDLMANATTRIIYDIDCFYRSKLANPEAPEKWIPVFAANLARETHVSDPMPADGLQIQMTFSYSDGFGREIQKKVQAEPGPLVDGGPIVSPRWVGSGWTVFNNKGKPVRQYEPFFSQLPERGHKFEFARQIGVSPIFFYDPVERVVATLHPNHTYEKVVFDPWQQTNYDMNDTVLNADGSTDPKLDADVGGFFARLPEIEYLPTWYEQRIVLPANDPERSAAEKAAVDRQTPTIAHFDALGRPFLTFAHNRFERSNVIIDEQLPTRVVLDIEGNQREVRDPVIQNGDLLGRIVIRYDYDLLGTRIHQVSMEAGERWMLSDVVGRPIRAWDSRGFQRRMTYDQLRRLTGLHVTENGNERLAEKIVYGEAQDAVANHRMRVYQIFDGGGVVTNEAYDFKGNVLRKHRRFLQDYKLAVNWLSNPVQQADDPFMSSTTYDAFNRPVTATSPDGSTYRPRFNAANLLDKVEVKLQGTATATGFVTNINYNAKGQRELIAYQNGVETSYEYDPLTFRLIHLKTTRPNGQNGTVTTIFVDRAVVQDLHYTYDPAGNLLHLEDTALKTVFYNNQQIDPIRSYTYDALYRLIDAQGREHIGQTAFNFTPPEGNRRDYPFLGLQAEPNDPEALRNYTERFEYDPAGNFTVVRHSAENGNWTRSYFYEESSLINGEGGKQSNRLTRTVVGNGLNHGETYGYTDAQGQDVHGCLTAINTMSMHWGFEDQLERVELSGGRMAYYVYDAAGVRVRKIIESQSGAPQTERVYLGGFEVYRQHTGARAGLVRETLHVMDDKQRIALVETRNLIDDGSPPQIVRFQLGDHLGSTSLELDGSAQLISYEEYTPYGAPAFQAVGRQIETPKRYRYMGKERDEETGFYYHGARYYAPWLGRWVSTDPKGIEAGANLYVFVLNNPTKFSDPDGRDVRLSVDQQSHTITYSTTVHIFASQAEIRQLRPLAQQAEAFYGNPTIETADETYARWSRASGTPGPPARQSVFTDAAGTRWSVNFDVRYQFHDTARSSPPFSHDTLRGNGQAMTDFVNNRAANEQTMHQSFGYEPGDNVVTMTQRSGNVAGNTLLLSTLDNSRPTFGQPESRMFANIARTTPFNRDETRQSLIHETGHLLGFDERYLVAGVLSSTHSQFGFDLMAAGRGSTEVTMHPIHIEEAGRFGTEVANGRTLANQAIRGSIIDSTGTRRSPGSIPLLDPLGNPNPAYAARQQLIQTELIPFYRGQVTAVPSVPPPVAPELQGAPRPIWAQ